ncbi:MAG TPA: hypothetical protein VD926_15270, partial [Acidimicrobiales bacterium]|nr:hypothetical protein [Acidimicrobiales bacterium]
MTEPRGARRRRAGLLIVVLVLAVGTASTGGPAAADANESPSASAAFRSISGGFRHTCGLANNGTVRCWGANHAGQLGQGTTTAWGDTAGELGGQVPPIDLGTGRTATAITSGDDHSCALLDDATVKCWGANTSGQLGQTTTGPNGDAPGEMGDDLPPISLGTGRTALSIAAGAVHTCALLDDFTVKCWGNNGFGQLGIGDAIDRGVDG